MQLSNSISTYSVMQTKNWVSSSLKQVVSSTFCKHALSYSMKRIGLVQNFSVSQYVKLYVWKAFAKTFYFIIFQKYTLSCFIFIGENPIFVGVKSKQDYFQRFLPIYTTWASRYFQWNLLIVEFSSWFFSKRQKRCA